MADERLFTEDEISAFVERDNYPPANPYLMRCQREAFEAGVAEQRARDVRRVHNAALRHEGTPLYDTIARLASALEDHAEHEP